MPLAFSPLTQSLINTADAAPRLSGTLYVNKVGKDGWLQAKSKSGELVPLFKYLRVGEVTSREGRTYFKVMEGPHQGRVLSLSDLNAKVHLGIKGPKRGPARITVTWGKYDERWPSSAWPQALPQQLAKIQIGEISVAATLNTIWTRDFYPLPAGIYTVLLPDGPHRQGITERYRNAEPRLQFDQVWFPILFDNNTRYLHVGHVSEGCVSVTDLASWSVVHEALLSHRTADGRGVGQMVVRKL